HPGQGGVGRLRAVLDEGAAVAELLRGGDAIPRLVTPPAAEDEPALDEVVEDAADGRLLVVLEARQELAPGRGAPLREEGLHGRPEGDAAGGRRLTEALHLLAVGAERHPEHRSEELLAHALVLELGHEAD